MPENKQNAAEDNSLRLHRYIAQCGIASRRKAEIIIQEGRVLVNGEVVTELGTKVNPGVDSIEVDGKKIGLPDKVVYLFYKPRGVLTTLDDPHGRPTVASFLPPDSHGIKPVGRLDFDTDGLLLFTNDGELAFRITHPKYQIEKEYTVVVSGNPTDNALKRLARGVIIEGQKTSPAYVEFISYNAKKNLTTLKMVIHEGRKRQIRLMCQEVNHPVKTLRRIRIGFLKLHKMDPGQMVRLTKQDVERLKKLVKLDSE